jgi:GNAT superfamily N-acetyltransferase
VLEIDGWLAPFDDGTIGRAKSAAPLSHSPSIDALSTIAEAYRERRLAPAFRIPDTETLAPVQAALTAMGFAASRPTLVKVGDVEALSRAAEPTAVLLPAPDQAWAAVFIGEGFDPVDGAHRVTALSRSPQAVYAAVRTAGSTVAVGVASFGHGWGGVHGMRTHPAHRGQGHATRILATLGGEMQRRGCDRVFLQVEEGNPARRIYRAAGFAPVWRYHYWR